MVADFVAEIKLINEQTNKQNKTVLILMQRLHAMLIVSTYKIAVLENLRVVVGKEAASNLVGFAG